MRKLKFTTAAFTTVAMVFALNTTPANAASTEDGKQSKESIDAMVANIVNESGRKVKEVKEKKFAAGESVTLPTTDRTDDPKKMETTEFPKATTVQMVTLDDGTVQTACYNCNYIKAGYTQYWWPSPNNNTVTLKHSVRFIVNSAGQVSVPYSAMEVRLNGNPMPLGNIDHAKFTLRTVSGDLYIGQWITYNPPYNQREDYPAGQTCRGQKAMVSIKLDIPSWPDDQGYDYLSNVWVADNGHSC